MNDETKELITSSATTMILETFYRHWDYYANNVIKKLKWIKNHFNGIEIAGGTFDWKYINVLSAAESSRSNTENKSEMKKRSRFL